MKRFFRLLIIFVLPVWMFDGCVNRDPNYYLDEKSSLGAGSSRSPLTFEFRDRDDPSTEPFQLHDVRDFLMGDSVFTGRSEGNYFFIVQRADGKNNFFATEAGRDAALVRDFSTSINNLRPKPWYSGIRANALFPFNLMYYLGATVFIVVVCSYRPRDSRATAQAE